MTAVIDSTAREVKPETQEQPPGVPTAPAPFLIYPDQKAIVLLWSEDGTTVTTHRVGGVDHYTAMRHLNKAADTIGDDFDRLMAAAQEASTKPS